MKIKTLRNYWMQINQKVSENKHKKSQLSNRSSSAIPSKSMSQSNSPSPAINTNVNSKKRSLRNMIKE